MTLFGLKIAKIGPKIAFWAVRRRQGLWWTSKFTQICRAEGAVGVFRAQPEGWTASGGEYVVHALAWGIYFTLSL